MRDQLRDGWRRLLNFTSSRWEATRKQCSSVYAVVSRKVVRILNSPAARWQIGSIVLPLLVIAGGILFYAFFRENLQQTATVVGLILQVVGIATAIKGLRDLRRMFEAEGILESLTSFTYKSSWTSTIAETVPLPRETLKGSVKSEAQDRFEMMALRIENLESGQKKLRERIEDFDRYQNELRQEVQKTNREFEAAFTGNLNLEMIGIFWLLIGSVLSSLPAML